MQKVYIKLSCPHNVHRDVPDYVHIINKYYCLNNCQQEQVCLSENWPLNYYHCTITAKSYSCKKLLKFKYKSINRKVQITWYQTVQHSELESTIISISRWGRMARGHWLILTFLQTEIPIPVVTNLNNRFKPKHNRLPIPMCVSLIS